MSAVSRRRANREARIAADYLGSFGFSVLSFEFPPETLTKSERSRARGGWDRMRRRSLARHYGTVALQNPVLPDSKPSVKIGAVAARQESGREALQSGQPVPLPTASEPVVG